MVCTANDLLEWNDFPKGLRVLLLDEDSNSLDEIKLKLENMEYIVSSFCNENEALAAISNRPDTFHVAIIEVSSENCDGRFKFLEAAKDLPTIMTSNIQCLSTMMKCIALGAVEFLLKPLSDDKLKNIWQHVVHKAFNAGGKDPPKSFKPIKESVFSMVGSQFEDEEKKSNLLIKSEENKQETSTTSDKFPAPPTPQFVENKQQISTNFYNGDQDGESKFVDTTSCNNMVEEVTIEDGKIQNLGDDIVKDEEQGHSIISKSKNCLSSQTNNKVVVPCGKKPNRKKMKVDWTPHLHKKFVQAVEQLGVDQAIPSRILEIMKVEGLTRHNIASHLQKYRMQHRPILPKEDDRMWPQQRDLYQRTYYPHRPIMAYPIWGPHGSYPSGPQMWGPPYYSPWQQPMESWHLQTYPGMNAESWGCPVMPPPLGSCQPPPHQNVDGFYNANVVHNSYGVLQESVYRYPGEEEIDRAVKEAISKPWLPLPIGLKPPSTDSVLTELSKLPPCHVTIRHH